MNGIIVVNAYATTKSELNQALRLQEEFSKLNVSINILHTDEIAVLIEDGNFSFVKNQSEFHFKAYPDGSPSEALGYSWGRGVCADELPE